MSVVRSELTACADAPVWALADTDLLAALDAAHAAQAQLAAMTARLVREVDGRGLSTAAFCSSTAAFLRDRLRISPWAARKLVDLARAVDERPLLAHALADGTVNVEQASVIGAALTTVAAEPEVTAVETDAAEAALVAHAAQLDPLALRKVGDRILSHVAPELADRIDAAVLTRQEERAYGSRGLRIVDHGDGRVGLSGLLTVDDAAAVNAALDPLCRPVAGDERSPAQRRADALVEVCQLVLRTGELPVNGGDRPQVVVTVPYDVLDGRLGLGLLDTGERLAATTVRRMACDALILPAVLGQAGQVLDMGRANRLFSGAVRRALVARDGGCAFPGCTRPPRWCDGHHIVHWQDGGPTTPDNGVLLCGPHHRLVHHSDWRVRLGSDARPEFLPPATIDPQQRPRTNLYHRRQ